MNRILLLFAVLVLTNILSKPLNAQSPWPDFVFKHWVWEDESTQHSALQLVDDYKAHNIPVGAIIIDSPWETGYNSFEFDTSLFPNAQAMVDSFHARDVKVIVWITTAIDTDQHELWHYADSMGYFMKANAGSGSAIIHWWKGDGSMIDFFNPAAVTWWKTLMDKVLNLGIDGWKCDGTDYSVFLGNATYSPGAAGAITRLQYSAAYYRLFHDYTRQRLGNDRANMSRPVDNYGYSFITDPNLVSFTPRDIGFACWVGDQDATFDGMQKALNNMYQSNVNNYLAFGSDIGGYRDEPVTNGRDKDVFIRWAQLGAFSPLMENGGGGEHRPWLFDQETDNIYRKFARLHTALVPYQMHQADSLFALSQSLMQFVNGTEYPYTLGSDIFVTPITSSSNTVSIGGFPGTGDSWVYLFDHSQVYPSGGSTIINVPIGEYPVFIKSTSPLLAVLDSVISSTTGIETLAFQQNAVSIYPNPAKEEFNVSGLNFNTAAQYDFKLFDAMGRNLLSTNIRSNRTNISTEGLESGIYYYSILPTNHSSQETISGHVVILK
jgi:alpha-glucosidase (family GH31 glycosyl hydrolase)